MKTGLLVKDNYGRIGIVIKKTSQPETSWLAIQKDKKLKTSTADWYNIVPLGTGGLVVAPEDLIQVLRPATKDDFVKIPSFDREHNIELKNLFK